MSCWHHYGPSCGWPPPPEWVDVYQRHRWVMPWEPEEERRSEPERWRRRGSRRDRDEELGVEALEARAQEIREELERIESNIERLAARAAEGSRG